MKIVVILVVIILVAVTFLFFMANGPDISQFEHLKEPKISTMKDQRMVVAEAKGDPNVVGGKTFDLLFKTYFKIKGTSKGPKQSAPRVRWPISQDVPKSEWVGFYAMPVPEQTVQLPESKDETEIKIELTTWEYGDVAEILHVGPYNKEKPTIKRLVDFIKEQSYEIAGDHEEEYIKGPGMFLKGNPEKYITIIRYRVKKQEDS
jgi:effector-binding domain-containing protein